MSVIGFDIGNESCVIAAAKRGGVDVLLNDESKRETPTVVTFGEKQRFLGSAGAAFASANLKSTVSQIKRLIGKLYKEVEEELKLLPLVTREGPRGGILIELEYLKTKWSFTPVEILGMLFKHLKQITEKNLESAVVDCVIGIPSYFSDLQRRMYLDAASIAGLKPLSLLHDGTAIALGYGLYKTDFSNKGPTIVMFVDIGHCDTQVTVAAFEEGKMEILSHTFDPNLGGRDFDEVLFKYFATQFNEQHKIDVYSNPRASVRLRAACEKAKKVLSANADAPLSIECLIGDTDVRGFITRDEFEKLSSSLLERVIHPCNRALRHSNLTADKISTIELVGSGSRIPAITRYLTSFFEKEPTRTLNASECVARGCALRCAMLSPALKVRDYEIKDSFPYSIVIPSEREKFVFFQNGSPFPDAMLLDCSKKIPFNFPVAYINKKGFPAGISHSVGRFRIGSSAFSNAAPVKVKFVVKLNHNGIVEIDSANIVDSNLWRMAVNKPIPVTGNLDFSTTSSELHEAQEKEKKLEEQDKKVEEIKDQRNTLESFVYDTRSKLSGAYKSFATDPEKEVIINNLQETEDWLYEDSDDESEHVYTGKLADLKKLLEPIENKYIEEKARAKAAKSLQTCIEKYQSHADSLPADQKEKVKNVCFEAEQWFNSHSSNAMSAVIDHKIGEVKSNCESIIRSKSTISRLQDFMNSEQRDQPVESKNARTKAKKDLQTCIKKYCSLAVSFPVDIKEKVENACNEAEQWLTNAVYQNDSSPKISSTEINNYIDFFESTCQSIIRPDHLYPRLDDEHVYLDQTTGLNQPLDSENDWMKAANALQTRIEHCRSVAETLPADKKDKVKNECNQAEWWLNSLSQQHTPTIHIHEVIGKFMGNCENIIKPKSSIPRQKEPVGSDPRHQTKEWGQHNQPLSSENAKTEATKALHTCFSKYRLDESLSAVMKEKVHNVFIEAQQQLNVITQSHLSPTDLTNHINRVIESFERDCESIINPKSSIARRKEPVGSDHRTTDWGQRNQPVSPEKARTQATKALQTCKENYHLHIETLSADSKEKVHDVFNEAEKQLNVLSQRHLSPSDLTTQINLVIEGVKSDCESIIRSNSLNQSHNEQWNKKNQPVDSETAKTKATKALETCKEEYRSHFESLSADSKGKFNNVFSEAERQLNDISQTLLPPNDLTAHINQIIVGVKRDCESIIKSSSSSSRRNEHVGSVQRNQPSDSENAKTKTTKALQTCIAKYRSDAEPLPANVKAKVNNVCNEAERLLNNISQSHISSNDLTTHINQLIEYVERDCERIIASESSLPTHEEPVHSNKSGQDVDMVQSEPLVDADKKGQDVDMDQADQFEDSHQRDPNSDFYKFLDDYI